MFAMVVVILFIGFRNASLLHPRTLFALNGAHSVLTPYEFLFISTLQKTTRALDEARGPIDSDVAFIRL
jgi:hypothetical protein